MKNRKGVYLLIGLMIILAVKLIPAKEEEAEYKKELRTGTAAGRIIEVIKLEEKGKEVIKEAQTWLREKDEKLQQAGRVLLYLSGEERYKESLLKDFASNVPSVKYLAAYALVKKGEEKIMPELMKTASKLEREIIGREDKIYKLGWVVRKEKEEKKKEAINKEAKKLLETGESYKGEGGAMMLVLTLGYLNDSRDIVIKYLGDDELEVRRGALSHLASEIRVHKEGVYKAEADPKELKGYDYHKGKKENKEAIKKWEEWWEGEKKNRKSWWYEDSRRKLLGLPEKSSEKVKELKKLYKQVEEGETVKEQVSAAKKIEKKKGYVVRNLIEGRGPEPATEGWDRRLYLARRLYKDKWITKNRHGGTQEERNEGNHRWIDLYRGDTPGNEIVSGGETYYRELKEEYVKSKELSKEEWLRLAYRLRIFRDMEEMRYGAEADTLARKQFDLQEDNSIAPADLPILEAAYQQMQERGKPPDIADRTTFPSDLVKDNVEKIKAEMEGLLSGAEGYVNTNVRRDLSFAIDEINKFLVMRNQYYQYINTTPISANLTKNYAHHEVWEEEVRKLRVWWNQAKQQPFAEPE